MAHLTPHGCSPRRLAAAAGLVAALSAGQTLANPEPWLGSGSGVMTVPTDLPVADPGPWGLPLHEAPARPDPAQTKATAYEQILRGRVLRGEVGLSESISVLSGVGTDPVQEGEGPTPTLCFTGEAGGPVPADRIRDATLMLMATYQVSGEIPGPVGAYFGTGTVIRADEGVNRVLTAAHVTAPEMVIQNGERVTLRSVYAFDGEGRLVAELGLSHAHTGRISLGQITHELVQEDVAVLAPVRFPSEEMARSWQGRGVDIAPEQSNSVLFFYGEGGASLISGGFSGAALYNPDGQVVGLISEMVSLSDTVRPAPNTMMPEAVLKTDLSAMSLRERQILEGIAGGPSEGVYVDSVAAGPPLSGPALLSALGVDPDRIRTTPALDVTALYSAGFPGRECRETWLRHEPRPDVLFRERPDRHMSLDTGDPTVLTGKNGYIRTMWPDGSLSEEERVGGFFFGGFGSWGRANLSVEDPFKGTDPEDAAGGPR
jgi:hypothetical protein